MQTITKKNTSCPDLINASHYKTHMVLKIANLGAPDDKNRSRPSFHGYALISDAYSLLSVSQQPDDSADEHG